MTFVSLDLALVFATALGLRLLWATLIPPWNAPDELAHFTYVAHIVEQHELPHPPPYLSSQPVHSIELQNSVSGSLARRLSPRLNGGWDPIRALPLRYDYGNVRGYAARGSDRWSEAGSSATGYPPLYYLLGSLPYATLYESPILARLFGVRFVSAMLGALSCCFAYLFAHEAGRSRRLSRVVGFVAAVAPMQCFVTACVNNDAAMVLASTILCWLMARTWNATQLRWPSLAVYGVAAGLALMTKATPAALVAAFGMSVLYRSVQLAGASPRAIMIHLQRLLVFTGMVLAVCAPWFFYKESWQVEVPASGIRAPVDKFAYSLSEYLDRIDSEHIDWVLIRTYWGSFGWLDLYLPELVYRTITYAYLASAVGLAIGFIFKPHLRAKLLLISALVLGHALFLFIGVDYLWSFAQQGQRFGIQGRYFFATSAPISFLLATGFAELIKCRVVAFPIVCVGALLLHLVAIAALLSSYYGIDLLL